MDMFAFFIVEMGGPDRLGYFFVVFIGIFYSFNYYFYDKSPVSPRLVAFMRSDGEKDLFNI